MKRGLPMNEEITERVIIALESNRTSTVEHIRRWLNQRYDTRYSWNTIRKHLNTLIEQNKVREEIISNIGRKVSVFRLSV